MRLALLAAAALVVLLALGALLWLAPRRSTDAGDARASAEPPRAGLKEDLAPVEPLAGEQRVSTAPAQEDAQRAELTESTAELAAAGEELATVLVHAVAEEDGLPMGEVVLYAEPWPEPPAGERVASARTDAFGLARFSLPPGSVRIVCRTQVDRALPFELAAGERGEASMRLRRDADLDFHLRIGDAETGEPVARALLNTDRSMHPYALGTTASVRADELGLVALRLPSWGVLSCQVLAEGYAAVKVQLAGDHATRERAKAVLLARAARLEGTVLDEQGLPLGLARVSATATKRALSARNPDLLSAAFVVPLEQEEWAAASLAGGRYELPGLPPDVDLTLEVRERGELLFQEVAALRLKPGEVRVYDLHVGGTGAIEGVLLDAGGAPRSMVPLVLLAGKEARMLKKDEPHLARAMTDKKGRFAFQRLRPGTWLIGPANLDWMPPRTDRPVPLAQVVELPAGVPKVEVELRLPPSLSIQGRCIGPDGEPVGDVNLYTTAGGVFVDARSGADGAFALGPLPPGEYELAAEKGTELTLGERPLVRAGTDGVLVKLGAGARIHGTVADAQGTGHTAEVQSVFHRADGSLLLGQHATDAAGRFELTRLSAGRYVLVARTAAGFVSRPHALTLGPSDDLAVELAVEPGGQARLRLPEGEVAATVFVDGERMDFVVAKDGTTRPLRPGPITVELMDKTGVVLTREAKVAAGEVVEVDLR